EPEIQGLARAFGLDGATLIGKPLRSIRGVLCATGKVRIAGDAADADVPLAYSSLMAGAFGFIELVHEVARIPGAPTRWKYNTLHPPRHGFLEPAGSRTQCYLCSEVATRSVHERMWST